MYRQRQSSEEDVSHPCLPAYALVVEDEVCWRYVEASFVCFLGRELALQENFVDLARKRVRTVSHLLVQYLRQLVSSNEAGEEDPLQYLGSSNVVHSNDFLDIPFLK